MRELPTVIMVLSILGALAQPPETMTRDDAAALEALAPILTALRTRAGAV
jgi:hypothetical protein